MFAAAAAAASLLAAPAAARADTTAVNTTLSAVGDTTSTLDVPVPPGVSVTSVDGILTLDLVLGGSVSLLVNGRTVATVPARAHQQVSLPLRPSDVSPSLSVELGVRYDIPTDAAGCRVQQPVAVVLRSLELNYTGTETQAVAVAGFFPAASPRIDVLVPNEADDDLLEAGLVAVAALSSLYPEGTPLSLTTGGVVLPRAGAGQRVVKLAPGDGAVQSSIETKFGLQTLTLTGSGDALVAAARALGSEQLVLADAAATQGLAATLDDRDAAPERSFEELGIDQVALSALGRSTASWVVAQDAFGGPVDSMRIRAFGTHSAVAAGVQAQLSTYLNGFLLDSQILEGDSELSIDATVPDSLVTADNELEFVLSALPGEGECLRTSSQLPLEVFLDGQRSTIETRRGDGRLEGFDRYPQVLGGVLPVAIRSVGSARTDSAIDAALLVSALQRVAVAPLEVSLVDADDFIAEDLSGLLVGADYPDSVALQAPLRLSGTRSVDRAEARLEVGTDQPFATLEAVVPAGRHVLMLGAWTPSTETDPAPLSRKAAAWVDDDGWAALTDDVLVAGVTGQPFTLSANAEVAAPERAEAATKKSFGGWFALGMAILLVLLVLQVAGAVRRDRKATAVDGPGRPVGAAEVPAISESPTNPTA